MRDECLGSDQAAKLRSAVKDKYSAVAEQPAGAFPYPVGRESALSLGYACEWVDAIPPDVVDRFVGVGNPFRLRTPSERERVLDVGCGCGFDSFVASILVGAGGRVVGVDLTPGMLAVARRGRPHWPLANVEFAEASVEELPYDDASFDLAISNAPSLRRRRRRPGRRVFEVQRDEQLRRDGQRGDPDGGGRAIVGAAVVQALSVAGDVNLHFDRALLAGGQLCNQPPQPEVQSLHLSEAFRFFKRLANSFRA